MNLFLLDQANDWPFRKVCEYLKLLDQWRKAQPGQDPTADENKLLWAEVRRRMTANAQTLLRQLP